MKKYNKIFMGALMAMTLVTGCSSKVKTEEVTEKLKIVTTIFPEYDWTKEVLGDRLDQVELTMLLDNGVDLHSYQATTNDIITISDCDLFIYVGGESDSWVDAVLSNATNPDMKVINLVELLGDDAKVEELVEGMQDSEHNHDHGDEDTEEAHDHDHDTLEYDEHVWLSLRNAALICQAIAVELAELDSDNASTYQENATNYIAKLAQLDGEYEEVVERATYDTILVADRFPFRYLVDDYEIDYYAAFVGCSAETEASFETITFLAGKLDELELATVLTTESSDKKIAETVISATQSKSQQIKTLNSMQSISSKDVANGVTYLSIMEENLLVLKEVLE